MNHSFTVLYDENSYHNIITQNFPKHNIYPIDMMDIFGTSYIMLTTQIFSITNISAYIIDYYQVTTLHTGTYIFVSGVLLFSVTIKLVSCIVSHICKLCAFVYMDVYQLVNHPQNMWSIKQGVVQFGGQPNQ